MPRLLPPLLLLLLAERAPAPMPMPRKVCSEGDEARWLQLRHPPLLPPRLRKFGMVLRWASWRRGCGVGEGVRWEQG